jgi:2-dehydropantoate 2-reductase
MRIAVIGAGGVGGAFGAALAQASGDVIFVARGEHLAAMRAHGLRVEGDRGVSEVRPCMATDDPGSIGPVDVVLFCVKLWDVERAGAAIRPLIGAETAVIPVQNGVDAPERLAGVIGPAAVMGGTVGISATIARPGVVRQVGTFMTMSFGEWDGSRSARAERFLALCQRAGFEATLSDAIETAIWMKFILLTAMSGATALTRLPIGRLRDDPEVFWLFGAIMRETEAVGRAKGVRLPEGASERLLAGLANAPSSMMASMAHDLVRGNRLELPWLAGKVVALGRELGVATPVNTTVFAALKPYADGASADRAAA